MQMTVLHPPIGFRKAIPALVKLNVVIRQDAKCSACGARLGDIGVVQFDHVPALQLRAWDQDEQDTVPGANDPESIFAKHTDCHAAKTTGRKGESKLSKVGGDVAEIAKVRRLTRKQEEFRRKIELKGAEQVEAKSKKRSWPKREFQSQNTNDRSKVWRRKKT